MKEFDRNVTQAIERGDYPLAYLKLFRRLVENSGEATPSPPITSEMPSQLDVVSLTGMAEDGNPWQLAKHLGAWIAWQQGGGQLGRALTAGGAEYRLLPVSRPAADWPTNNSRHWFYPLWPVPRFLSLGRQSSTLIEVDFVHLPESLADEMPSQRIKVFAAEFCDRVQLEQQTAAGKFHCTGLRDPDKRWQSIESALDQARKWQAHVVLMPELSVTAALRQQLAGWLRQNKDVFRLVVAGSFHQNDDRGNNVNRCVLFRGNGLKLGEFDKWLAYRDQENIAPGKRLLVLNTTSGLWLPAICLDFLQREEGKRERHPEFPWERISGDLLLVASMGHQSTVAGHRTRATTLADEFYPRVVVANMTPESDGQHPGFAQEKGRVAQDNNPPHSMWPLLHFV